MFIMRLSTLLIAVLVLGLSAALYSCGASPVSPSSFIPSFSQVRTSVAIRDIFLDSSGTGRNYTRFALQRDSTTDTLFFSGRPSFRQELALQPNGTPIPLPFDSARYSTSTPNELWVYLNNPLSLILFGNAIAPILTQDVDTSRLIRGWVPYLKTTGRAGDSYPIFSNEFQRIFQSDTSARRDTFLIRVSASGRVSEEEETVSTQTQSYRAKRLSIVHTISARPVSGTFAVPYDISQTVWCADGVGVVKIEQVGIRIDTSIIRLPIPVQASLPSVRVELNRLR
jgi:hypothetical protein